MSYQDDNRDEPPPLPSDRDAYADRDQDDRNRYQAPGLPRQQPGQAGCSKGCMYGLMGCGCLTVLMVIGMGVGFWKLANWYSQVQSTDPAVIRKTAQEIADFEPPAGLKPQLSTVLIITKTVAYASDDGMLQLTLEQIDQNEAGKARSFWAEFEDGFKTELENDGQVPRKRVLDVAKSELREIKIRGQNAKITLADAKDREGLEFKQITGTFQGKGGPVALELQIPKEKYKEEDVVKFLEGIK